MNISDNFDWENYYADDDVIADDEIDHYLDKFNINDDSDFEKFSGRGRRAPSEDNFNSKREARKSARLRELRKNTRNI